MNPIDLPLMRSHAEGAAPPPAPAVAEIDLMRLWSIVRRQWLLPVIGAVLGAALAFAYLATTPAEYTAMARVLIEDRLSKLVEEVSPAPAQQRNDATILSEMEVLGSTAMAETVVRELELHRNADFMNPPVSLLARTVGGAIGAVRGLVTSLSPPPPPAAPGPPPTPEAVEAALVERAVMRLQGGLIVQRAGRSFAILIGFESHSPPLARDITNAYTRAYLADELDSSLKATRQAADWMQARLGELQQDSQAAALAVERFRAEEGLTATRGQLISEQELSELSSQLVLARAEAARAQARFQQYADVARRPVADAVGEAVLRDDGEPVNPALVELRNEYRTVEQRLADVERLYGADHPQVATLRTERARLERAIASEIERTVRALENAYRTAEAREKAIASSVETATGRTTQDSQAQVRLRELEQRATALSTLYTTFLARFEEVSKQQSFPISKVRVLSDATLPRGKSAPRSTLALAALTLLGGMAGAGLGALRELRDRVMRTEDDVRRVTGAPCLGYIPHIAVRAEAPPRAGRAATMDARSPAPAPAPEPVSKLASNLTSKPAASEAPTERELFGATAGEAAATATAATGPAASAPARAPAHASDALEGIALHAPRPATVGGPGADAVVRARMLAAAASPSSMLAETLRNVRIGADVVLEGRRSKVIGVVSALPGEGKTLVAANLAAHIAAGGTPVLLIDGDLRKPSLSRALAPAATAGLVDVLLSGGSWQEAAGRLQPGLPLAFLPNVLTRRVSHAGELLSSQAMRSLLAEAGETFPFVVVDLPPLVPVADARALAPMVDAFVAVAAWGETPRALLRREVNAALSVRQRLLGTILNRVDLKRLLRYEDEGGRGRFMDRLDDYYAEPSRGVVKV